MRSQRNISVFARCVNRAGVSVYHVIWLSLWFGCDSVIALWSFILLAAFIERMLAGLRISTLKITVNLMRSTDNAASVSAAFYRCFALKLPFSSSNCRFYFIKQVYFCVNDKTPILKFEESIFSKYDWKKFSRSDKMLYCE